MTSAVGASMILHHGHPSVQPKHLALGVRRYKETVGTYYDEIARRDRPFDRVVQKRKHDDAFVLE
jgi:hypothetical protein